MPETFLSETFLLPNRTAVELFERYARMQPIIDYHCHLPPQELADDRRFGNMTQIWLAGDHYKWRAMRANGVPERYITGDASDWEKFSAWAATVPKTLRNPLYHWTHMELKRPFGISGLLVNEKTARTVWEKCNARLQEDGFSARGLVQQMNVKVVCTTDDPTDTLEHHRRLAAERTFPVRVLPAFRPDRVLEIDAGAPFIDYVHRLGEAADVAISSYNDLLDALRTRHRFFHSQGCRLSDHGLETVPADEYGENEVKTLFAKAMSGGSVDPASARKFRSAVLFELCLMDHEAGWVQQFHLGALRNVNPRMMQTLGRDTGYDAIGQFPIVEPLARLLGRLDEQKALARTIVYNLNPADTDAVAALLGSYQDGTCAGKMQYGSAWWFLDQKDGIERQLTALSNMGLLSRFVGMLTDSRSFLSYSRHEYFRRILCAVLGDEMERGLLPNDLELVGTMVADICYRNAQAYFAFDQQP